MPLRRLRLLAAILIAFSLPLRGLAAQRALSLAGLAITVWLPDGPPPVKAPVIFFSHGFHGCATQSSRLMQNIAAAAFLNHYVKGVPADALLAHPSEGVATLRHAAEP